MSTETLTFNSDMLLSTSSTLSAIDGRTIDSLCLKSVLAEPSNHDSMVIWVYDEDLPLYIQFVMRMKLFKTFKCVRTFTDRNKFIEYLSGQFVVTTLRFIVSGEQAKILCNLVKNKLENYQVYELDIKLPETIERNSDTWSAFNNVEELFKTIYNDLNQYDVTVDKHAEISDEKEYKYGSFLPPLGIFNSPSLPKIFHFLDKESSIFLLFQLLNKIIIEMEYTSDDFNDMCSFCREHYRSNPSHMVNINSFRKTYCSENAIKEYTKDSFLFRLLSKVFHNEDTDGTYNFRSYIKDLHIQLHCLNEQQKKSTPVENEITLYRGKKLSLILLQQLQELYDSKDVKVKLISVNGFLSTTSNRNLARVCAGSDGERDGYESVLFTLKIDKTMATTVPHAFISDNSCFPEEEEVLFSMGSIWELMKIERINTTWMIELKCSTLFDGQFADLPRQVSADQASNDCYLFLFAKILHKLGKYSQAVEHYEDLLKKELSNKFKRLIHLNLATMQDELGQYTNAQKNFEEILTLDKSNTTSPNDTDSLSFQSIYAIGAMPSRLVIYNNMGVLSQKKRKRSEARSLFEKAAKEQGSSKEMSIVLNNLGNLENICGDIEIALQHLKEAVKLAENSIWSEKFKEDLKNMEHQQRKNK